MRHRSVAGLVIVAGMLGGMGWAWGQAEPPASAPVVVSGEGPKLELTPMEFNFGEVWQGQPARGEFTVKNVGSAPLTVDVRSGCGCTLATRPKSPLAPGESSTFSATYDTQKYLGGANKTVTVTTNDPAHASVTVPIRGNVRPLYLASPTNNVNLQMIGTDKPASQTLRLENRYEKPMHLKLKPDQDFGVFEVKLAEVEPGKAYDLTVTTRPPLPVGFSRTVVHLDTGLEISPEVLIQVSANAQPLLFASPPRLYVAAGRDRPAQQVIRLQSRTEEPVEISKIEAIPESVKFELLPAEPHTAGQVSYRQIRVTLPPLEEIPETGGKLVIHVEKVEPQYQTIEVPILRYTTAARKGLPERAPGRPTPVPAEPTVRPSDQPVAPEKAGGDS